MKKYIVFLTAEEQEKLKKIISSGRGPTRLFTHARILLKADQNEGAPGWNDQQISQALDITVQTVERLRRQFVEEGFESVLSRREYKQKISRKKIDGEVTAHLIALACSKPPEGRTRWTLRLLADSMIELQYVDQISHEAIRQTLKKTKLSLG